MTAIIVGIGSDISRSIVKSPKGTWPDEVLDGVEVTKGELIFADFEHKEDTKLPLEVHLSFLFYSATKNHMSFLDAKTST